MFTILFVYLMLQYDYDYEHIFIGPVLISHLSARSAAFIISLIFFSFPYLRIWCLTFNSDYNSWLQTSSKRFKYIISALSNSTKLSSMSVTHWYTHHPGTEAKHDQKWNMVTNCIHSSAISLPLKCAALYSTVNVYCLAWLQLPQRSKKARDSLVLFCVWPVATEKLWTKSYQGCSQGISTS